MCVHLFSHVFPIFFPMFFPCFPRYVAGNLEVGARVQATRPISYDRLQPVVPGAVGTVLGPALEEPLQRIVVRWDALGRSKAGGTRGAGGWCAVDDAGLNPMDGD